MRRFLKWAGIGLVIAALVVGALLWWAWGAMTQPGFWEREVIAFERADRESFPDKGLILFTGSSSIRLWSTLEADMAPLRVLNRGFGGAHMDHVVHFADRIIAPYQARAIVVYAGDNDIGSGKTPETVEEDFLELVALVRAAQPTVPIYFLTIKASRSRWQSWPVMDVANRRIQAIADADPTLHVIDVSAAMIERGGGGKPPAELFIFDGLHLSQQGYALWTPIVRQRLLADLGAG